MKLRDLDVLWRDGGNDGALERPRRNDDATGFERAIGRYDRKSCPALQTLDARDLDAGADRRIEVARVGLEVIGDLILASEPVRIESFELHIREAVVPGGTIGDQRIPAAGTPAFGDAVALQHEMWHTESAQVFAHCHASLTRAYDQRVDRQLFSRHGLLLLKSALFQVSLFGRTECTPRGGQQKLYFKNALHRFSLCNRQLASDNRFDRTRSN
jgi:hypothetical protein